MATGQTGASGPRAIEPRLGLLRDVLDELRWTFSARKGWLLGIAGNLLVAYVYLAVTQPDPRNFGDIKAANVGLAILLWALADPINTNQLGNDCERATASLESGDSVARVLAIKNLALAVMFIPLAFAISLVHRIVIDRWTLVLHTAIADVAVVFIWQGVGSVVSLLLPYRPISLPARLKARKTWRRYGIHQASTYIAYGAAVVLHFPFVYIYVLRLLGPVSTNYLDYALVYLGFGFMYWGMGLGVAALYGRFAREELISDMRICVATADRPWPPVKKLLSAARRRRRHHG